MVKNYLEDHKNYYNIKKKEQKRIKKIVDS